MAKTIDRAEFDRLNPTAQGEHVRSGGIVSDPFAGHTPRFLADGLDRARAADHAMREWAARRTKTPLLIPSGGF